MGTGGLKKHGKEVVIMEPVKGGVLAQIPEAAEISCLRVA